MTLNPKSLIPHKSVFWLVLVLVMLAAGATEWGGGVRQAASAEDAWTNVTLIYSSDCKGKTEPCG